VLGKIKLAVAKGIVQGILKRGDKVVCLSGVPRFGYADSIFVLDVGKEFEILTSDFINDLTENVRPEVFNSDFEYRLRTGRSGEGKPQSRNNIRPGR